jgi:hypothetical protein
VFVILSELFWLVRLLMISDMNDKRIASQQKVNRSDEAGKNLKSKIEFGGVWF